MSRPFAIAAAGRAGDRSPSAFAIASLVALAVTAAPRGARANGAFPESYQVVLPADRPSQIILATNFGLIISDDDGATWSWTCESKQTVNATLYGVSAPALDRLFAVGDVGLSYSDDASCTWQESGGSLATMLATDYFADATNPMRVWAAARHPTDATVLPAVYASDDGGATFGPAVFTAAAGQTLSGVESARADPKRVYVASYALADFHPWLARSDDGGASWTTIDLAPSIGLNTARIIAVDPNDADVVTIRVIESTGESLAISHDGGHTFTKMFRIAGSLTSYARLQSGTILVAGFVLAEGVGFRSTDGGMSFQPWTPRTTDRAGALDVASDGGAPRPPHLRALAARGGKVYAAAKNFSDDWALGVSTDDGVTFERLMRYQDVSSIRACAVTSCMDSCDRQAGAQVWPPTTCGNPLPEPPAPPAGAKKGCGCALEGAAEGRAAALALCVVAALATLARSRRRRR
jgi:photosystem II stability/assembly factor-like uncharacterized protein